MSEAFYYKGRAMEYDTATQRLYIDGQVTRVTQKGEWFETPELPGVRKQTLSQLAEMVIKHSTDFERRERFRSEHLSVLQNGVEQWNQWRKDNPEIRPILYDAPLNGANFSQANFSNANLIGAQLQKATLIEVNFHEANLFGANLHEAVLTGSNFCRTDLYKTDLSGAKLTRANLQGTQLAMTDFRGARLIGCTVYGLSAWDIKIDEATRQKGFIIRYRYRGEGEPAEGMHEAQVTVDDLQLAQFVYLLLNNENIRNVIDTIGKKGVLILGRFTSERKAVLDAIRRKLRDLGYVPMMFDFERPTQRDFTETIKTLAGMSRFIIADITNPKSSPLELRATMPDYMIPFVPIIHEDEEPFTMFQDLQQKYGGWVLDLLKYNSTENLLRVLEKAVIEPALEMSEKLLLKKQEGIRTRHTDDYL
jgi:hypothetical protein